MRELSDFIDGSQEGKITRKPPMGIPQPKFDATILNLPTGTPLAAEKEEQAREDIEKVAIVYFHGVPFMQGQLTNQERREVGKRFIDINREYLANGLKNSNKNERLKSIYTRTTTASSGVDNHKMLIDASLEKLDELTHINQLLRELLARFYSSKSNDVHNVFLSVIQKYINSFTSPDLMPFFWNNLTSAVGTISTDVVQYRFPVASTSKAPDHAFKYGMGYSVEEDRGEKRISPQYINGRPKHRLAGLLYLIMPDLATYRDMENESQIVDAIQYHKAAHLKLHPNIAHQSETVFLGGVDGENVALVIPLVYLNFTEKNREFYKKIFDLSDRDWNNGRRLQGSIEPLTKGNQHTKEFRLLLKIYLPFIIKLAKTVAHLQHKDVHFVDSYGNLNPYSEGTVNLDAVFCTVVSGHHKESSLSKNLRGANKNPH